MPFINLHEHVRFDPGRLAKHNVFTAPEVVCDVYCLLPGQEQKPHTHDGEAKFYYVIEGEGEFTLGEERRVCGPGWFIGSASGQVHGVANPSSSNLVLLVGIAPNPKLRRHDP